MKTEKETAVLNVIQQWKNHSDKDNDIGMPIEDLLDYTELQEVGIDKNMQAIGGVIGSLVNKGLIYIQTAEEYSLGCDCIDIY